MGLQRKRKPKHTQRRMSAAQKRKFTALAGLVILCAAFVIGIFYSSVYRYVHRMEKNQIEQNVFIQGMNATGMTRAEALQKLNERWNVMKNTPIVLTAGEHTAQVTASELGIRQGDVEALVDEAAEYGKHGNLFQRYRKIRQAKKEKVEYEDEYQIDEDTASHVLEEKTSGFFEEAVDAGITRVGGVFQITDEQEGEKADLKAALDEILDRLDDLEAGKEVEITVGSSKDEPKIARKDLEKVQDPLGSAQIGTKQSSDRQELVTLTGDLNGKIVMPEEELSLRKILGNHAGEECSAQSLNQMASSLYDAALYAELKVSERAQSETLPDDMDSGMEAVLDNGQDLKIENTTDAPLYIESYVNGDGELVCTIYGQETRDEGRKLSFRSETEEEEDPNVIYEEDTSLAAGRTRVKEQGAAKSTVTLIKVIEEDGRETEEEMGTSVYQASDRVVSVGTRTNDDEIKQALKEAVAAQDEEAVEAAVRQARNQ